jgi:thiamine-phosphate pyrophosphorylase
VVIVFTDRRQARRPLADVVRAAVEGGARLVVLREKDLPDGERVALAARLRAVIAPLGGLLSRAGRVAGPDGRHLAAADPWPPDDAGPAGDDGPRDDAGPRGVIGRSCHDAASLAGAAAEGAAYATISPVFASRSKPGYGPPLGLATLRELCAGAALPVYALGGVETAEQAADCRAAGAAGVAVMGAVMRAADPAALVASFVSDLPFFARKVPFLASTRQEGHLLGADATRRAPSWDAGDRS